MAPSKDSAERTIHPQVRIVNGKKTFIPLENNPQSLTALSQSIGISSQITYHDVFSLSEPTLLSMTPRPALGLILLAPGNIYHAVRENHTPPIVSPSQDPSKDLSSPSSQVYWSPQTVGHACGLMALLHCILNGKHTAYLEPNTTISDFYEKTRDLSPEQKAEAIYDSEKLERAHMSAAAAGSSLAPDPCEPNGYHFIAFVGDADKKVWELEGTVGGPVECMKERVDQEGVGGAGDTDKWEEFRLGEGEDLLSERAVEVGAGRYMKVAAEMGIMEMSVVAVVVDEES